MASLSLKNIYKKYPGADLLHPIISVEFSKKRPDCRPANFENRADNSGGIKRGLVDVV